MLHASAREWVGINEAINKFRGWWGNKWDREWAAEGWGWLFAAGRIRNLKEEVLLVLDIIIIFKCSRNGKYKFKFVKPSTSIAGTNI